MDGLQCGGRKITSCFPRIAVKWCEASTVSQPRVVLDNAYWGRRRSLFTRFDSYTGRRFVQDLPISISIADVL